MKSKDTITIENSKLQKSNLNSSQEEIETFDDDDSKSESDLNKSKLNNVSHGDDEDEFIVAKEEIAKGNVNSQSYLSLFYADEKFWGPKWVVWCQVAVLVGCLSMMLVSQLCLTYCEYFLGSWSSKSKEEQQKNSYATIFGIFVIVTLVLGFSRAVVFYKVTLRGARHLHDAMFKGILHSPMRFFESQPRGRIINRCSKDQYVIDELLPTTGFDAISIVLMCSMVIVAAGLATPFILILLLPGLILFVYTCRMFLSTSRVLKRLESTSRSPVCLLFVEMCNLSNW